MTASDPRVGEIQATVPLAYRPENRQAATDDLIRMLTESADIPGNVNLPREAVDMILAELRDRDEKLAKVEAIEKRLARSKQCEDREIAEDLRAAVAAANGGGDRG